MKFVGTILLLVAVNVNAFNSPNGFVIPVFGTRLCASVEDDNLLFESILSEGASPLQQHKSNIFRSRSNNIVLPDSSAAPNAITMASAVVSPPPSTTYGNDVDEYASAGVEDEFLSSATKGYSEQAMGGGSADDDDHAGHDHNTHGRAARAPLPTKRNFMGIKYTDTGITLQSRIRDKDYNGIITSYIVPITALGVGAAWTVRQAISKYNIKIDSVLTSYANEMVYHDGDFEEMEMCHADYKKRLVSLGPTKMKAMIKSYLEIYAKKKPVSPQAISSMSYVLSMYKLSEQDAAKILVEVANTAMADKLASAGKLLFFGERILNSPEGQLTLQPIRDMLANNYRSGGKMILQTSQKAMGEAAYRTAVAAAGKEQSELTVGWEVLDLTKETAQRIFDEVAETGFKTRREILNSGQRKKFDKKGRPVDSDGNLLNSEDEESEGGDDAVASGSIFECTECGYTLFPAKGREFKFFPDDFKCPGCGAAKDKFVDRANK